MVQGRNFHSKKIYDAVHGFIRFDEEERELINTYAFQRLRYIHQLGLSYLIYPGASHTRFEHSLGVMELTSRIFEALMQSVRPDLFHFIPRKGSAEYFYWQKVLRLAALCHDLGHLPFSHVAERELLPVLGHEEWTLKIIRSEALEAVFEKIAKKALFSENLSGRDLVEDIIKLALGEEKLSRLEPKKKHPFTNLEKVLSQIIVGDFFGADRIDYLLRDSICTGISYGLMDYQHLIEMLRILPKSTDDPELVLGIDENGLESCEALALARHFMYRRVYQHPSVRAFNFHLKRFMRTYYQQKNILTGLDSYLLVNDSDLIHFLKLAYLDRSLPGHLDAKIIFERKNHFKAIPLSDKIDEKILLTIKEKNNLQEADMQWEISEGVREEHLSFPVLRKHLPL
ncbi:MAG: HD domain-containing protein, partial [Parachlamydiales bacterium]